MSRAFFSFYALVALVGIGAMIGVLYESKGRGAEVQNTQHFYTQSQLYQSSLLSLAKVCLQKYDLQRCKQIHLRLEEYEAKITIEQIQDKLAQIDIVLEVFHPLNSGLLRSNYRGYLSLENL